MMNRDDADSKESHMNLHERPSWPEVRLLTVTWNKAWTCLINPLPLRSKKDYLNYYIKSTMERLYHITTIFTFLLFDCSEEEERKKKKETMYLALCLQPSVNTGLGFLHIAKKVQILFWTRCIFRRATTRQRRGGLMGWGRGGGWGVGQNWWLWLLLWNLSELKSSCNSKKIMISMFQYSLILSANSTLWFKKHSQSEPHDSKLLPPRPGRCTHYSDTLPPTTFGYLSKSSFHRRGGSSYGCV